MSILYIKLLAELNSKKRDLSFNPEVLDKLTADERFKIEKKLVELCNNGVESALKYIPYIKNFDPTRLIGTTNFENVPNKIKYVTLRYCYLSTPKDYVLNYLKAFSLNDIDAFKELLNLFNDVSDDKKYDVLKSIDEIIKKNSSKEYANLLNRIDISDVKEVNKNVNEEKNQYNKLYFYDKDGNELNNEDLKKIISEGKEEKEEYDAISSIVIDGTLGFAVGDALGVPVEFLSRDMIKRNPVEDMLEYGSHKVPKGTWSDDTSMMVATMDSISDVQGIDYDDMMQKFCDWARNANYTATDTVFDIGISTSTAISNYMSSKMPAIKCGPDGERQNGNGSLMRMFPIAVYCMYNNMSEKDEVDLINNFSSITHGHEISKLGCKIYSDYMKYLVETKDKFEAYNLLTKKDYSKYYSKETIEKYKRILDGNLNKISEDNINSSGYVVSTLEASLWCTLNSNSYEEAVLNAVNLGSDTDTVGAITGGINGVIYGVSAIRQSWKTDLKKVRYLYDLSCEYAKTLINIKKKKDDVIVK